jgi:hypothetical protein
MKSSEPLRRPRTATKKISRPVTIDGERYLLTWHLFQGVISLRRPRQHRARAPFITVEQLTKHLLGKLL